MARIIPAAAQRLALLAVALLMLLLSGCASTGVTHADVASQLASVPSDKGRIVFYRDRSVVGAAIQPNIFLDGALVGESKPGGFFHIDAAPGNHEVSAKTEVTNTLALSLRAGQTLYVRSHIGFGLVVGRIHFEQMPESQAQAVLVDLQYTGGPLPSRATTSTGSAGPPPGASSGARPATQPAVASDNRRRGTTLDDLEALLPKHP